MSKDSTPLYIFIHLAKTGGTTFVGHLYKYLQIDEEYIDLGPHGDDYRREHNRSPLEQRSSEELAKVKIIGGHLVRWGVNGLFPDRQHRYITFLREPISRVISHYTFDSSEKEITFPDWYQHWIPNQMCLFWYDHLNVNTVAGILNCFQYFWHIGLTEQLTPSLHQLYDELGVSHDSIKNRRVSGEKANSTLDLGYNDSRVIKQKYTPTKAELKQIIDDHQIDIWLYKHVRSRLVQNRYIPDPGVTPPRFTYSPSIGHQ